MLILSESFIGSLPANFVSSWVHASCGPGSYTFTSRHMIAYRKADEARSLVQAFVRELSDAAGSSSAQVGTSLES